MDLPRSLIKDFAKIANNENSNKKSSSYVRGTVKMVGDKKFVQLDGSSSLTPIGETVDVQEDDRVLVTIENHSATVLGNFTFPPSARKEQEAINKAEDANDKADDANSKADGASATAKDAAAKADSAIEIAGDSSIKSEQAKKDAAEALEAAGQASQNSEDAKKWADEAKESSQIARDEAEKAQDAVANANAEMEKINKEVETVKGDISGALTELGEQAAEIQATKETMELNYAKKTEVSTVETNLKTEISKKVGELQTTVEQNYAAKTDVVDMEGKLQSQITQNAEGLSSQASKVEKLETDTTEAKKQIDIAIDKADNAQTAADLAQTNATNAQATADVAKQNAQTAATKAEESKKAAQDAMNAANLADEKVQSAQSDLNEAKQNLENVTNRVGATEQEIADAQAKVDQAQKEVNQALADAAEANLAATNATNAANKAQTDANNAQTTATEAQKKADNASLAASEAQKDADKALQDVSALTKRVTSAETKITQNSEKISLEATKTEEIGKKVDGVKNDLSNNYYTKTQTDAKIKFESDRITSTVSKVEIVEKNLADLEIGGRNLILNSDTLFENENYLVNQYTTSEDIVSGTIYTVTIWGKLSEGKEYFGIWMNGSSNRVAVLQDNEDGTYTATFKAVNTVTGRERYLSVYAFPQNGTGTSVVEKLKLELGNKATDWTPAPEDLAPREALEKAEDALDKSTTNSSTIETQMTKIEQLYNSIKMLVVDDKGGTLLDQTTEGWQFNIGVIPGALEEVKEIVSDHSGDIAEANNLLSKLDGLTNDISAKTAYINITTHNGQPALLLGQSNNAFKLRITNTSIDFLDGTEAIAYISNQNLYITRAIIKDELQIGDGSGFVFKLRTNGNLGIRWEE